MSIILKGNNISSSNNNGVGPGEVTNIKASQSVSSIILSWTNPSNVVINGTTLSTFDHVIIVKNEDHCPMSIKDGNTIYSGNGTTCSDNDVIKNKKYYYRFFVYDTNKLCNNNINMIIENTFYGVDPILKNNTWEQINAASEAGIASSIWNIGDEIDITFSNDQNIFLPSDNLTTTLQIWDFKHFDKSDGTGKAGICFGMKNLLPRNSYSYDPVGNNTQTDWNLSQIRTKILNGEYNSIYSAIPEECRRVIKNVNVYSGDCSKYDFYPYDKIIKTQDYIFIPELIEVGLGSDDTKLLSGYNSQFPIFTDNNSRIKNSTSDYDYSDSDSWMLRGTVSYFKYNWQVTENGESSKVYISEGKQGICICFNV